MNTIKQKRSYRKRSELASIAAQVHGLSKRMVDAVRTGIRKNDEVLGTLADYNKWKEDTIELLRQKQEIYVLMRSHRKMGIKVDEEKVLKLEDEIDDLQSYYRFRISSMIEATRNEIENGDCSHN